MKERDAKQRKSFNAVENKRRVQEAIHEETKDLSWEQLVEYYNDRKYLKEKDAAPSS